MIWWQAMLVAWAVAAVVMAGLWAFAMRRRNAGWVDVAWSFGTGAAGVFLALQSLALTHQRHSGSPTRSRGLRAASRPPADLSNMREARLAASLQ